MKYHLYRKYVEIYYDDIFLLPTIRIVKDNLMYSRQNISIQFHFLMFHFGMLWKVN